MRRRVAAAAAALALIVGGCSPDGAEEQMTRVPTREEVFIAEVHEAVPESKEVNDTDLIEYGEAVCDALEAGATVEELGTAIGYEVQNAEVAGLLGGIGGVAARTLCPGALENGG